MRQGMKTEQVYDWMVSGVSGGCGPWSLVVQYLALGDEGREILIPSVWHQDREDQSVYGLV